MHTVESLSRVEVGWWDVASISDGSEPTQWSKLENFALPSMTDIRFSVFIVHLYISEYTEEFTDSTQKGYCRLEDFEK